MYTGDYSYSDNGMYEAVIHSINQALVYMITNIKRKISEMVTPAADEIPAGRNFVFHMRNLKASS